MKIVTVVLHSTILHNLASIIKSESIINPNTTVSLVKYELNEPHIQEQKMSIMYKWKP